MRAFLERWKAVGPLLEAERRLRLIDLDDDTARTMTLDLFSFWTKPEWDVQGEELVAHQYLFNRYRARISGRDRE